MTPIQNKKALAQSTISAKADGDALFHHAMNGAAIHSNFIILKKRDQSKNNRSGSDQIL